EGSRLTPALMPPVATKIGKHAGEVANSCHARPRERCASVGVAPSGTAVCRLENEIGVVVGEATAAFVHTCDVYGPVASQVARDLHVAHKGSLGAYHHRAAPGGASISRINDENVRVGLIKV